MREEILSYKKLKFRERLGELPVFARWMNFNNFELSLKWAYTMGFQDAHEYLVEKLER